MKKNLYFKIIASAVVFFSVAGTVSAQQTYDDATDPGYQTYNQPSQYDQQPQTTQQDIYSYPEANVYYDPSCNNYIYNNGSSWLAVKILPRNIYSGISSRFVVHHNGPRVWMDNAIHMNAYRRTAYREPIAFNGGSRGGYRNDNNRREFGDNNYRGGDYDNHDRGNGFREAHYRR